MPTEAAVRSFFKDLKNIAPLGDPAGQKTVFACDLPDGRSGVLKLVALPEVTDEDSEAAYSEAVGRLRREITILASIDSPYVTRLAYPACDLETATIDACNCAYFFEERIPGPSVEGMIGGGTPLDSRVVARLGAHISHGIKEFWSRGQVHRDVKPANIMHNEASDLFVLLDAGYALDLNAPSYTRLLGVVGTVPFLSPEQLDLANKRSLDFRADLYALGLVMYVALTCRHPYIAAGMNQDQQLQAIVGSRPTIPDNPPAESVPLWEIILRLLEKQPHARYRSCDLVAGMLDGLY